MFCKISLWFKKQKRKWRKAQLIWKYHLANEYVFKGHKYGKSPVFTQGDFTILASEEELAERHLQQEEKQRKSIK